MAMTRRAWAIGGAAALLLLAASGGAAPVRVRPHAVNLPSGLTRRQLRQWAAAAGVPEGHLVMAIMLASERPGRAHGREQAVIAATAVNRLGYPRVFGSDLWGVIVNDAPETGAQKGGWRPYATSRAHVAAADLAYYIAVADAAIRRGPGQLGGITNFHHSTGARGREVTARWVAAGYQVVNLGVPATVFAPTPAKAAALRGGTV